MRHYVSPFVVAETGLRSHLTVVVERDPAGVAEARHILTAQPATAVRTSHPRQRYRVWTAGNGETLLPNSVPDHVITRTPGLVSIAAEHTDVAATVGTRVVRQLIMRGGEAQGGRSVHSAAVDIGGRGVLVTGHPGSGKTTVFTHLIEEHGAHPVSNDRTILVPTHPGRWNAVGVPLAARFTPEGMSGSPLLAGALDRLEPTRGRHLVDGKVELTPGELASLVNRPFVPIAEVALIAVLTRTPPSPIQDEGFLRRHLDFGAEDFFADDWLDLSRQLEGPTDTPNSCDELWDRLAGDVPRLSLTWTDPTELPNIASCIHTRVRR
ncbi:hypothetical protein [Streptomonospora salina]|uniref:Uncharacterized protein n=1 Tax=Streptomonospora salina TaxID=104205 RepID=A0A841E6L2_9ACTN|nr:hypothetical protein [Streptomonospora salina]MBB5998452.1 hypothetical protein [Streptomonospora salina]